MFTKHREKNRFLIFIVKIEIKILELMSTCNIITGDYTTNKQQPMQSDFRFSFIRKYVHANIIW